METELVSEEVVDAAVRLHQELGPGLLESVNERVLGASPSKVGLQVDRQKPVGFGYDGMRFDLPVGLLLNFGHQTMKEGIRRVVNNYSPSSASPRLRVKSDFGAS